VRNSLLIAIPAVPLLLAAGFWNPPADLTRYDAARWIDSGLEHERQGDFAAAERDLLEAARVDRLFQPRWTLAGFYFRRSDINNFWHWTREALAVDGRDSGALFDLCWKLPGGSPNIWINAMPDSKPVWDEYLFYLMTTGKWLPAAYTAEVISQKADAGDKPLLMNYCDLALARDDKAGASAVWYGLRRRKLLPFAPELIITNGDFREGPTGRGFDWRIAPPGISNPFHPGEASFTLNGFQQEHETFLEQLLSIDPTLKYRLEFEYKTTGFDVNSGIHWTAGAASSDGFAASAWTHGQFDFPGPAESLELVYQRPKASTMAEGTVWVRNVSLVVR
jgi:hypothetical protein